MQKMSTQKLEMGKQNDSVDSIDKMVSRKRKRDEEMIVGHEAHDH